MDREMPASQSEQFHWELPSHPWTGPEPPAHAIVQLGSTRSGLTRTTARRLRRVLSRAWRVMFKLEVGEALTLLDTIEPGLAELDSTALEPLRMEIDLLRAAGLALQDNSVGALPAAASILRQSHARSLHLRQGATTICRLAYWKAADFEGLHSLTRSDPGIIVDKQRALAATVDLSIEAAIEFEQLRLGAALRVAHDAATLAEKFLSPRSAVAALPHSIVARVLYEGGNILESENLLRRRLRNIATRGTIETALLTYPVLARIAAGRMQLESAYELLREAESLGERRGWLRLKAASLTEQVHLLLSEARHEEALAIVKRLDDIASDPRSGQYTACTSIQRYRLIAKSRFESAYCPSAGTVAALRQLHQDAVRRRDFHLALQAVLWIVESLLSLGDQQEACSLFDRALELGASSGMYQIFIDYSSRVAQLLPDAYDRAGARGSHRVALLPYIGSLLNRWRTYEASRPAPGVSTRASGLLSQREQHVLKLIGSGLSNKQIAQALDIAPETVKSHAKNIFVKLDVKTRTEAAMYAQRRGIL